MSRLSGRTTRLRYLLTPSAQMISAGRRIQSVDRRLCQRNCSTSVAVYSSKRLLARSRLRWDEHGNALEIGLRGSVVSNIDCSSVREQVPWFVSEVGTVLTHIALLKMPDMKMRGLRGAVACLPDIPGGSESIYRTGAGFERMSLRSVDTKSAHFLESGRLGGRLNGEGCRAVPQA